jgi:hypothetical protein
MIVASGFSRKINVASGFSRKINAGGSLPPQRRKPRSPKGLRHI